MLKYVTLTSDYQAHALHLVPKAHALHLVPKAHALHLVPKARTLHLVPKAHALHLVPKALFGNAKKSFDEKAFPSASCRMGMRKTYFL